MHLDLRCKGNQECTSGKIELWSFASWLQWINWKRHCEHSSESSRSPSVCSRIWWCWIQLSTHHPTTTRISATCLKSFAVICLLELRSKTDRESNASEDYYKWWFVNNLLKATIEHMMPIIGETPLANCFLRLLGLAAKEGGEVAAHAAWDKM